MYPVGSCYFSTVATSPATVIGGTWVAMTGGMLGLAGSTGIADAAANGGSRKISITQLPAHVHDLPGVNYGTTVKDQFGYYPVRIDNDKASNWRTSSSSSTGGGADYIPAHTSVYGWRRTA